MVDMPKNQSNQAKTSDLSGPGRYGNEEVLYSDQSSRFNVMSYSECLIFRG